MQQHVEIEIIYRAIKDASQEIATFLRYHSAHLVESLNPFGKQQSNIDLEADRIIIDHLTKSGVVYAIYSEEQTDIKVINESGNFTVTYDPIDGNNVLDVNMSVASIFGIWNNK
jgi:fructose-1,6-bisphosphatase I